MAYKIFLMKGNKTMKRIALLLALVLCFSCFAGFAVSAEGAAPSQEIEFVTVPMRATVSILYAISAEGYESLDGLKLVVDKNGATEEVAPAGTATVNGKYCIIFQYDGLSAAEMDLVVSAHVEYNGQAGEAVDYSVKTFADAYAQAGGKYVSLVEAMLRYGAAVKAMQDAKNA